VFFYFDDGYYVSCLDVRYLISFPVQRKLLTVRRPLIVLDRKSLRFPFDLLTLTYFAAFGHVNDLTGAAALIAWNRSLTVHARAHLPHYCSHASSLAGRTTHNC